MGGTLLHFSNFNALPRNIVGCALSAPDGSSPQGYSRKKSFSSIGSRDNVTHHTSTRKVSTSRFFNSRYFNFEILHLEILLRTSCRQIRVSPKEFHLISLKVAAPKAIIKKSFIYALFVEILPLPTPSFSLLIYIFHDVK
jgi:hypothetical protein